MAGEWESRRLADVATVVMGQSPPGATYNEEGRGLPFFQGVKDFSNRYPRKRVYCTGPTRFAEPGDILFSVRAPIGEINRADERCCIGRGLAAIRGQSKYDTDYLEYVLSSIRDEWHILEGQGAVFGNAKKSDLENLIIPWPEEKERRAIARILGTLDDKIELNRRMNETLESMAQALFKSWFIDFDPVVVNALKAGNPIPDKFSKHAAHYRENPDALGLPEQILRLFPDRFVDSELGPIPEGWEVKFLDQIAHFQNGLALQKYRPQPGEPRLPVVKIAQLRTGRADGTEWASANIRPECIIDDGDVVFSWSGSLLVKIWCGGRAALNQHLFKVTSQEYPKWFYYGWIQEHLLQFVLIASDKATTMGHIRRHHLSEAGCVVPGRVLLEEADALFASLLEEQIRCELESRTLATLRDTLLPKLISGELRVPDVEKILEDAV